MRESLTVGQRSTRGRRGLSVLPFASLVVIAGAALGGGTALAARRTAAKFLDSSSQFPQSGAGLIRLPDKECVVRPHFGHRYLPLLRRGITKEDVARHVRVYQMGYLNRLVKAFAAAKTQANEKALDHLHETLKKAERALNDAERSFNEGGAVRRVLGIRDPRAHDAANALQVLAGNLAVVELTLARLSVDAQGAGGVTGVAGGEDPWFVLEQGLVSARRAAADALRCLSGHKSGGKTKLAGEVDSVVADYAFWAQALDVEVTCDLEACRDIEVPGGRRAWRDVLRNLIQNVIRHGGEDVKEVIIRLEPTDTGVRLTFADDGEGIAPEHLEDIWISGFTTKTGKGSGLGLANVKSFIKELGGTVTVEPPASQDPTGAPQDQTGARFVFDIPLNRQ